MFKQILTFYESNKVRRFLVDLALVCFIVGTLALVRFLFVIAEEAHRFRVDFVTEGGSITTALQMGSSQLSSNLNDLNVSGKVITSRLDSQITDVRALLNNAAKQSQQSSRQEMKTTRDAIQDSITSSAEAMQTVADQTSVVAAKPVQVTVQPSAKTDEKPPTVTVQVPAAPQPKVHSHTGWGRFWHFIFRLKD